MFFKRGREDKTDAGRGAATESGIGPPVPPIPAAPHTALPPEALRRPVDAASLGFQTTAELEPISGLIGQDRALRAIEFGANMKTNDFNIFVLGPPASGKATATRAFLSEKAADLPAPFDWVYVYNFDTANRPRALRIPPGRARMLEKGMVAAIDELRITLPQVFEGEDYQARRRSIDAAARSTQEEAFEALSRKAQSQNIAIMRTPTGFGMAPMHEGKIVKPEVFNALPEEMQKGVQTKIEALQKELEQILEAVPKADKARRNRLSELNEEVAHIAVIEALDDIKASFADVPEVLAHLEAAHRDLVRNVGLFLATNEEESQIVKQPVDTSRDPRFRRYMINVVVTNGSESKDGGRSHAPIVEELNPTYANLIGRVDHIAQMGALMTDFLLIKPGALHRANGGYLLLDARKLLMSPFAWEALKRAMKAREIRIEQPAEVAGMVLSTQSLDPEPIPLDVKVVLTGDRELYYMLSRLDPDFGGLFKVQADFDDTIERSPDNYRDYARVMASIVRNHGLKPLDAGGVALVLEESARLASDREKLSIEIGRISDVIRESDYWATKAGRAVVTRADVARAIDEHTQRSDRLRDRSQETIDRAIVLIDTDGAKVGQINALSVLQLGDFSFGRPSRITARVRMGQGRVTDIEREVNLGGPLHSKGVMILWGFLAGRFAQDVPLAMAATLVFEQSYGGVDGDSASSTELYALLSALAEVPVEQRWAVTGSVNQWGEVQAIGGANEKIEGFFDVCRARGLTGRQGVLIPQANVQHLMLREDVVQAVRDGKFAIHAVSHIDEGIEILTGIKAGERGADGKFEPGTVNHLVEEKLRSFAERARAFGRRNGSGESTGNGDRGNDRDASG
jgi:lon-related putative ATP-dependent protease